MHSAFAALALLLVPLALAGGPPAPVPTCQPAGGAADHHYLPPGVSQGPRGFDGNLLDCDGNGTPDYDGELDAGVGGVLLAVSTFGPGGGSLACWGMIGHHAGAIHAIDETGRGPRIRVLSDHSRTPPASGPDCGDGIVEFCDATPPQASRDPFPANVVSDWAYAAIWTTFERPGTTCNVLDCDHEGDWTPVGPTVVTPSCGPGADGTYQVAIGWSREIAYQSVAGHVWT